MNTIGCVILIIGIILGLGCVVAAVAGECALFGLTGAYWLSFAKWNNSCGRFLCWKRIYRKGCWTPLCHIRKRYDSWFGFWKTPEEMCWLLADRTITFAGVPSNAQMQAAVNLARSLGLVPADQILTSRGMCELFLKPTPPEPEWRIYVPDGVGQTASITYKGERVPGITHLTYTLPADGAGQLVMDIRAQDIEAAMKIFDDDVEIQIEMP